jgi:hypothetical protein
MLGGVDVSRTELGGGMTAAAPGKWVRFRFACLSGLDHPMATLLWAWNKSIRFLPKR